LSASELQRVVLKDCPVELLVRSRRHTEALIREFAFIAESEADSASIPARLLAVVDRIRSRLTGLNVAVEVQIDEAQQRGQAFIDVEVLLPNNGRSLALELQRLFDEAEEFCRSGDLLTLAEPEDIRALRGWYLDQYVAQLDGAEPTSWRDRPTAER
jgi:hypothetical protein